MTLLYWVLVSSLSPLHPPPLGMRGGGGVSRETLVGTYILRGAG